MKMAVRPHSKSISQTHIKVNVPVTMAFRRPFSFGQMLHVLVAGAAGHTENVLLHGVPLNQRALSSVILIMGA